MDALSVEVGDAASDAERVAETVRVGDGVNEMERVGVRVTEGDRVLVLFGVAVAGIVSAGQSHVATATYQYVAVDEIAKLPDTETLGQDDAFGQRTHPTNVHISLPLWPKA
jgi:hypothetical protein